MLIMTWILDQKDLKLLLARIDLLSANVFEVLFSLLQVTMVTWLYAYFWSS